MCFRITCTTKGKYDAGCSVKIYFRLEDQDFEMIIPESPTTSPNIHNGGLKNMAYLAIAIILGLVMLGGCVGLLIWRKRRGRKQEMDDGGSSILPLPVNGAGYLHPRGRSTLKTYGLRLLGNNKRTVKSRV